MRIFLDLDTRRILTTPTRAAARLEFKRRDNDTFEVQFLRAAVVQELPAATTARVGIKATGDFAGAFLATDTLTQSGTGSETTYSGTLNLNTTALEALFTEEPASIAAMLEIEWTTAPAVGSSLTLPVIVHNDVIRGDEGDPAELPIFYTAETSDFLATQAQAEAGAANNVWMSPLRTAQAIAALGGASSYLDLADVPTEFPPESHTHAIADTESLQAALDSKQAAGNYAATSHTHALADLTQSSATTGQVSTWNGTAWVPANPSGGVSSYNDLTDVPTEFPPATHTHAITNITGLQTALDGKASATHTHAIADVTGLQSALDAKQPAGDYVTASGGITAIAVVATMPATPDANTLYIVTT